MQPKSPSIGVKPPPTVAVNAPGRHRSASSGVNTGATGNTDDDSKGSTTTTNTKPQQPQTRGRSPRSSGSRDPEAQSLSPRTAAISPGRSGFGRLSFHHGHHPSPSPPPAGADGAASSSSFVSFTPKSTRSGTVELLVVGNEQPPLARGLSIKLSPPEDEDELSLSRNRVSDDDEQTSTDSKVDSAGGPKYYYSLSGVSMASLGSFGSDMELRPPMDRVNTQPFQNVPINRTESRLPSLETLLADEKLRGELFGTDSNVFLRDFTASLRLSSSRSRFKAHQELLKLSLTNDDYKFERMSQDEKIKIIDALVLMIKQELAKHVDQWRYLVDQRKEGALNDKQYQELLSQPDYEVCIEPWAYISVALKMLRNFCSTDSTIQDHVHAHRVADLLMSRKQLLYIAVVCSEVGPSGAVADSHPLFVEVRNNLVRSVITFMANLLTGNSKIQIHMWNVLWPSGYWMLALLAGGAQFNHLCLLVFNHLSGALDVGSLMPGFSQTRKSADDADSSIGSSSSGGKVTDKVAAAVDEDWDFVGRGFTRMMKALEWLQQTDSFDTEEFGISSDYARVVISEEKIESAGPEFARFLRVLFAVPVMTAHEDQLNKLEKKKSIEESVTTSSTTGGDGKQSVMISRKNSAERMPLEEWLSLFVLKLFNLNRGQTLHKLVKSFMCMQRRDELLGVEAKLKALKDFDILNVLCLPAELETMVRQNPNRILLYLYTFPPNRFAKAIEIVGVSFAICEQLISTSGASNQTESRMWPNISRNFLTNASEGLIRLAITVFGRALEGFQSDARGFQLQVPSGLIVLKFSDEEIRNLMTPASSKLVLSSSLRLLLALLCAEETSGVMVKEGAAESVVEGCCRIIQIMTQATEKQADKMKERPQFNRRSSRSYSISTDIIGEPHQAYFHLLNLISVTTTLRAISVACEIAGQPAKDIACKYKIINNVVSLQRILTPEDPGASETAVLAIRVLTQNHEGNAKLLGENTTTSRSSITTEK